MWCGNCEQDVPGVAPLDDHDRIRCARCHGLLAAARDAAVGAPEDREPCGLARTPPFPDYSCPQSWKEDLLAADRLTALFPELSLRGNASPEATPPGMPAPASSATASSTPDCPSAAHPSAAQRSHGSPPRPVRGRLLRRIGTAVSWLTMMLGATLLALGGVLWIASVLTGRAELHEAGWPITLGGQVLLLFGLLCQLEGLHRVNRQQHLILRQMDQDVRQLRDGVLVQGPAVLRPPLHRSSPAARSSSI